MMKQTFSPVSIIYRQFYSVFPILILACVVALFLSGCRSKVRMKPPAASQTATLNSPLSPVKESNTSDEGDAEKSLVENVKKQIEQREQINFKENQIQYSRVVADELGAFVYKLNEKIFLNALFQKTHLKQTMPLKSNLTIALKDLFSFYGKMIETLQPSHDPVLSADIQLKQDAIQMTLNHLEFYIETAKKMSRETLALPVDGVSLIDPFTKKPYQKVVTGVFQKAEWLAGEIYWRYVTLYDVIFDVEMGSSEGLPVMIETCDLPRGVSFASFSKQVIFSTSLSASASLAQLGMPVDVSVNVAKQNIFGVSQSLFSGEKARYARHIPYFRNEHWRGVTYVQLWDSKTKKYLPITKSLPEISSWRRFVNQVKAALLGASINPLINPFVVVMGTLTPIEPLIESIEVYPSSSQYPVPFIYSGVSKSFGVKVEERNCDGSEK